MIMIPPMMINPNRTKNCSIVPIIPPDEPLVEAVWPLAFAVAVALVAAEVPEVIAPDRFAARPCGAAALPVTEGQTAPSAD
jgi:hypothetical protein